MVASPLNQPPPPARLIIHKNCDFYKKALLLIGSSLIASMLMGVLGCGVQQGRFVTSGDQSKTLLSPLGSIDIVDGYATKSDQEPGVQYDKHLLYVLIMTSCVQEHGSSSESDYGEYFTRLSHTWNTEKGLLTVSIPWNRQTDIVTIGNQKFNRKQGNVFVVRVNSNEQIFGQQLANPASEIGFQKLLEYIQKQLPKDKLIASIKI